MEDIPEVFEKLKSVELFPVGACGDTVRNITTCPLCGVEKNELFDVVDIIYELEGFFHNPENREYFNLPRKFKITLFACPYHCNMPEMHDLENRRSFVRARFRYMVDRLDVERIREMLLERLSFLPAFLEREPMPVKRYFHTGLGEQKQRGYYYLGIPVPAGRVKGSQLLKLSELMEEFNLSLRITQRQNLVLINIPEDKLEAVKERVKGLHLHKM